MPPIPVIDREAIAVARDVMTADYAETGSLLPADIDPHLVKNDLITSIDESLEQARRDGIGPYANCLAWFAIGVRLGRRYPELEELIRRG